MARLPRLVVPGQPHHIIQRGTNRQPLFRSDDDFSRMLEFLKSAAEQGEVAIHAYVLMHNHLHILATPSQARGMSVMMQVIGRRYVRYFNDRYQRSGALFEGRFKATAIDSERYLFACMAYIELNPVRAGMVVGPADYRWSSYAHNTGMSKDPLISEHPLFWALGNTPFAREAAYREIVEEGVRRDTEREITDSTLKGWVLGADSPVFTSEVATRRVAPLKRGRPRSVPVFTADESSPPLKGSDPF